MPTVPEIYLLNKLYIYCTHKDISGLPGPNDGVFIQKLLGSCGCFAAYFVKIFI